MAGGIDRATSEKGYVLSLLRHPEEPPEAPIDRLASLQIDVAPEDISNSNLRKILELILKNARRMMATSTRIAAQCISTDEMIILSQMDSVDVDSIDVYAEAILRHSVSSDVMSAAGKAKELAKQGQAQEALDHLAAKMATIQSESERGRISTLAQSIPAFTSQFEDHQGMLSRGDVRFAFPWGGLNRLVPYIPPGNLILGTAMKKVGKTSWAGQLGDWNARRGLNVLYFHAEDTPFIMRMKRVGRQMAALRDHENRHTGISVRRMLSTVLAPKDRERVATVNQSISEWKGSVTEIHSVGWTAEQITRTWHRLCNRSQVDIVIIDYLNKLRLLPQKTRVWGQYGARGQDAELFKIAAEQTGVVAVLMQQEKEPEGTPYQSKETPQKAQLYIRLIREQDSTTHRLDLNGRFVVMNANLGDTGAIDAYFYPDWMVWASGE
jgi:hypothetical protein